MEGFNWNSPVNTEIRLLAESRGDELIGPALGQYKPGRACDYRHIKLKCGHSMDTRITHYRVGRTECRTCFEIELRRVAALQDLELKSMEIVRYANERVYIRKCGHELICSNDYLKKYKRTKCKPCTDNIIKANIGRYGFSLVKRLGPVSKISCNICARQYSTRLAENHDYVPECSECILRDDIIVQRRAKRKYRINSEYRKTPELLEKVFNKLSNDAKNVGLTYLEVNKDRSLRSRSQALYQCNHCGYVDLYSIASVKNKNIRCSPCYRARLEKEARTECLEYIEYCIGQLHTYKLPCGCFRNYTTSTIRRGVWTCKEHGQTHYHRESGVYLVKITVGDFSWLKFGFAKNLSVRAVGYGLENNYKIEDILYKKFKRGYDAMKVEKSVHKHIKDFRLDPSEMKNYMKNTGHTECYPVEMQKEIVDLFKEVCNGCS